MHIVCNRALCTLTYKRALYTDGGEMGGCCLNVLQLSRKAWILAAIAGIVSYNKDRCDQTSYSIGQKKKMRRWIDTNVLDITKERYFKRNTKCTLPRIHRYYSINDDGILNTVIWVEHHNAYVSGTRNLLGNKRCRARLILCSLIFKGHCSVHRHVNLVATNPCTASCE